MPDQEERMALSRAEIARKATMASSAAARIRRYDRFVDEIAQCPDALSAGAEDRLAEILRRRGWTVSPGL
jgi:hypothetical protein